MKRSSIYIQNTNFFTFFLSLLLTVAGVLLLFLAADWDWLKNNPGIQTVVRDVGGLLIVSVALALIWELVAKRAFAAELMAEVRLAEDVKSAGIIKIPLNFHEDISWRDLIANVSQFDIFFAYGSTWRGLYRLNIQELSKQRDVKVRIVLPNPDNKILMEELGRRFQKKSDDVKKLIIDAKDDFIKMFVGQPGSRADLSIWYHDLSLVYSCYRFDHIVILALYQQQRDRVKIPSFIAKRGGSIYEFVRKDFDAIIDEQNGLARKIYPIEEQEQVAS